MNSQLQFACVLGTVFCVAVVFLLATHVWLSHKHNSKAREAAQWRMKELARLNTGLCNQVNVLKQQLHAKDVVLNRLQQRVVALSKESLRYAVDSALMINGVPATHRGFAKTEFGSDHHG